MHINCPGYLVLWKLFDIFMHEWINAECPELRSLQELQALLSGLVGSPVPADQPLMEAGLDSIGAVELRNAVSEKFGIELPATVTFDYPTAADLARFVMQRSAPAAVTAGEQPSATFQARLLTVPHLTV